MITSTNACLIVPRDNYGGLNSSPANLSRSCRHWPTSLLQWTCLNKTRACYTIKNSGRMKPDTAIRNCSLGTSLPFFWEMALVERVCLQQLLPKDTNLQSLNLSYLLLPNKLNKPWEFVSEWTSPVLYHEHRSTGNSKWAFPRCTCS